MENRRGMSTDPRASFSKSSSARGRIAQVLAQARASLNEPTRPVTPQLLDQRTSMPYVLEALPHQKLSKPKRRSSEKPERRSSESDRNFSSLTVGDQYIEAPFTSVDQAIDVLENFAPRRADDDDDNCEKPAFNRAKTNCKHSTKTGNNRTVSA